MPDPDPSKGYNTETGLPNQPPMGPSPYETPGNAGQEGQGGNQGQQADQGTRAYQSLVATAYQVFEVGGYRPGFKGEDTVMMIGTSGIEERIEKAMEKLPSFMLAPREAYSRIIYNS